MYIHDFSEKLIDVIDRRRAWKEDPIRGRWKIAEIVPRENASGSRSSPIFLGYFSGFEHFKELRRLLVAG